MLNLSNIIFTDDIPVYQQLANYFINQIATGKLAVGDMLPTELSISKELHISRATVRQAFQILEQDGRIIRKRRKGTFVCEQKLKRSLNNLYNFTTEMKTLGFKPSSRVLSFGIVKAPAYVATALNIDLHTQVYRICRLRMANQTPLLLEETYIPTFFCPNLTEDSLNDSLYAIISENTGLMPGEASETYEAINLNSHDATHLSCPTNSAALKITRISQNTAGQKFEYCTIIARGDMNKYQITLKNTGIQYTHVV